MLQNKGLNKNKQKAIEVQMYNVLFPLTAAAVATKYFFHVTTRFVLKFSMITIKLNQHERAGRRAGY